RSPVAFGFAAGFGAAAGAGVAGAEGFASGAGAPFSAAASMSPLVTRPPLPLPFTFEGSTPVSAARRRTAGDCTSGAVADDGEPAPEAAAPVAGGALAASADTEVSIVATTSPIFTSAPASA